MRYVGLLRGINVGGKRMLPMTELTAIVRECGGKDVSTYIQSGNVFFAASKDNGREIVDAAEKLIENRFGFAPPFVLRSAPELRAAIDQNPYAARPEMEKATYVLFLRDEPEAAIAAALEAPKNCTDEFALVGSQLYLWLPVGVAETKLTNAYFDAKLKTVSTARNWRTVLTLLDRLTS